jgi:hypothetical protein
VVVTGTTPQTVVVTQYGKVSVLTNKLVNVKVYPNPFNDGFYVNSDHWNTIVIVFDIRGRKILSRVISETEYIPLVEMDKGMYLLELINSSSTVIKKIIKR